MNEIIGKIGPGKLVMVDNLNDIRILPPQHWVTDDFGDLVPCPQQFAIKLWGLR